MRAELFIDGEWVSPASGKTFATIDPSTEEPIGEVARGDAADIDRAVRAADRALKGAWREVTPAARGRLLSPPRRRRSRPTREELARLETLDVGKPLKESRGDVDGVVATLIYNAGAADKMEGATIPLGPGLRRLHDARADRRHCAYRAVELSRSAWRSARSRRRSPPAAPRC